MVLEFKSSRRGFLGATPGPRSSPNFSPMNKLRKINVYQHASTTKASMFKRDGLSNPLRRTPKLGNSQAAKLANTAVIDTTDGFNKLLEGKGRFTLPSP